MREASSLRKAERLRTIRTYLIDLDGTTYIGERLIPGVSEFIAAVKERACSYLFVTNNSSATADEYAGKLQRLGIDVTQSHILTSGDATAVYLKHRGFRRLFVLGTPTFEMMLTREGFLLTDEDVDCVVLGFDKTLTYDKLLKANSFLIQGKPYVATHPDLVCPTANGPIPDCGAMIAFLSAASGRKPTVIGKPEPLLVEMAAARLQANMQETAFIGDRLYTDVKMAHAASVFSILVLTGESTREDVVRAITKPDCVVENLRDLIPNLRPLCRESHGL